jgi:hypothetical protein
LHYLKENLPEDPDNVGWVLGWGVFRSIPWELRSVYGAEVGARNDATMAGPEYAVRYGSHRLGSTDFVSKDAHNA